LRVKLESLELATRHLLPRMQAVLVVAVVTLACSTRVLASDKYKPLQEALPALPEELRLGSKYVPGTSTKYVRGYADKYDLQEWQEIPNWLGGVWRSTSQMRYLSENEVNGEHSTPKSGVSPGRLLDRKGNLWHYTSTPFTNRLEGDDYFRLKNVVHDKMRMISPEQVTLLIRSSSTEFRKSDEVAFRSYQQEGSYIYTLDKDGTLLKKGWCNHFDEDGVLRHRGFDVVRYEKIAPFEPIEELHGLDLRKSLKEYLESHHMENLIPK
jgi:hypothetical protein